MGMTKIVKAGTIIEGPDGQGYEVVRDLYVDDHAYPPEAFKPFGGAPEPTKGIMAPKWLQEWAVETFGFKGFSR